MAKQVIEIGGESYEFESKKEMLQEVGRSILSNSPESMTLRQLYYRFVALDLIENKQSQYQYLGEAIKEARINGSIPWGWIEDRTRGTDAGDHTAIDPIDRFERNFERFRNTAERHHRPRWEGQPKYVEVWVEKEALAGVFASVCRDLKVVSFPNRGYTSITLLKQAAERIREQNRKKVPPLGDRKESHILYFGDFDPSGQDIERNIREKLSETFGVSVSVERMALTRKQIDEHQLPPQPAKRSDSRYETFVKEHGDMAVELDALPPDELRSLIRSSVEDYFDSHYYERKIKPKEKEEREKIRERIDSVLSEGTDDA